MSNTPWLPASDVADARGNNSRFVVVERRPQYVQAAMPYSVIGGNPRAFGFQSVDATSLTEVFRSDAFITAPVLSYELQFTTAYGAGVTSINWQIEVRSAGEFTDTVVASGTANDGDAVLAAVDLMAAIGTTDIFTRLGSFRVSVSRNGGSGEGAGVRFLTPWLLRSPTILA